MPSGKNRSDPIPQDDASNAGDATNYPLGIICDAVGHTLVMTVIAYILFVMGTFLGLSFGSGSLDIVGLLGGESTAWILMLPLLMLLAIFLGFVSALLSLIAAVALWIAAVYSETLKSRLILLGLIFATGFIFAFYIGKTG